MQRHVVMATVGENNLFTTPSRGDYPGRSVLYSL